MLNVFLHPTAVYCASLQTPTGSGNLKIRRKYVILIKKISLKEWIFRKLDMGVWTGLSWLRIGTGGRHL